MKTAAIVIILIGFFLTLFTGIGWVQKKKVVDIGKIEITKDQPKSVSWTPFLGIGLMVGGGVMLFAAARKS